MIYTFYSFKGGVGRSMALANIAEIFSQKGLSVLVVDFDLEAPGLERYFAEVLPEATTLANVQAHAGIIDMLEKYKELRGFAASRVSPPDATLDQRLAILPAPAFDDYAMEVSRKREGIGNVSLITAGARVPYSTYARKVISFDWGEFYRKHDGELFFEWFRREAERRFSVVLIDSRTGVTEMSGVCTHQLADVVVSFVAANAQNIEGVLNQAVALAAADLIETGRSGRPLHQILVPSRVEISEGGQVEQFQRALESSVKALFPEGLPGQGQPSFDLAIPYVPFFAFNERVPLRQPDHPLAKFIREPVSKVAALMASFAAPTSLLYISHHSNTAQLSKIAEELLAGWENDKKAQARALFGRLVSVSVGRHGSTFAPCETSLSEFPGPLVPLVHKLVAAGLLVLSIGEEDTVVQLRDPQVAFEWDKLNRWIRGDLAFLAWLERVSAGSSEWRLSHSPNDLLSGTPLKESHGWMRSKATAINEREREFVLESQKYELAQRGDPENTSGDVAARLESSDPNRPLLTALRQSRSGAAILFLHGFGGDPTRTWGDFPEILMADPRMAEWDVFTVGYATSLSPDIVGVWRADAPVDRLALMFITALTQPPLSAYKSLAIVAHSMGGLILQRALLDDSSVCQRTSHVFLFGTPSSGLVKSGVFSFLKRQARDLTERSDFIVDLRGRWNERFGTSPPFRCFRVIAGDQDEFVPSNSSLGPFPSNQRCVVPGNHLQIVKPGSAENLSVQVVLNGIVDGASPEGPATAARLAIESRQFQRAVDSLLPHVDELDDKGLVELGIALDQVGRREEAIDLLKRNRTRDDLDATGVLAGRLKRRWLVDRRRSDGDQALELYTESFGIADQRGRHDQAFYHGVNVAFMQLAYLSDIEAARRSAIKVIEHCSSARRDKWALAAEGEALLILGDTREALSRYQQAVDECPATWEADSMYQQALRVADLAGDDQALSSLPSIFGRESVPGG